MPEAPPKITDTELAPEAGAEPVLLIALAVLAIVCFLAVTGLSRLYHAQQEFLGNRWFMRGVADLHAKRFDAAMLEFRSALRYSRDNYEYQLNLAEALIGLNRSSEAQAYLSNLWEREPENGMVNLSLARIAAQRNQTDTTLRYYHNAIYAAWPHEQETERREARLELIEYLLSIDDRAQAQSELIALQANLGDDAAEQIRAGDLFLRAKDYEHALAAYGASLKTNERNPAALAGAGHAAFRAHNYELAQHYLNEAVKVDPHDTASAAQLKTTEQVLQMDPFARDISSDHRYHRVLDAFETAGERLRSCDSSRGIVSSADSLVQLNDFWGKMRPRITLRDLERNPDLADSAMNLVFDIERQTASTCGAPGGADLALLLIAGERGGR